MKRFRTRRMRIVEPLIINGGGRLWLFDINPLITRRSPISSTDPNVRRIRPRERSGFRPGGDLHGCDLCADIRIQLPCHAMSIVFGPRVAVLPLI
jgi:hypothetical protein